MEFYIYLDIYAMPCHAIYTHPPELMFTFKARMYSWRWDKMAYNWIKRQKGKKKKRRKRVREWKENRREQRTWNNKLITPEKFWPKRQLIQRYKLIRHLCDQPLHTISFSISIPFSRSPVASFIIWYSHSSQHAIAFYFDRCHSIFYVLFMYRQSRQWIK